MTETRHIDCPRCGAKGRVVDRATPAALLRSDAKARLVDGPLRFCRSAACDVVYFDEARVVTFAVSTLTVPVFQKSTDPQRPVCYCFDHSVRSIEDEVAAKGTSEVPESIAKKCKAGLDDCEHNNPQGSCCLGNVRQVVKAAVEARGGVELPQAAAPGGCCGGKGTT